MRLKEISLEKYHKVEIGYENYKGYKSIDSKFLSGYFRKAYKKPYYNLIKKDEPIVFDIKKDTCVNRIYIYDVDGNITKKENIKSFYGQEDGECYTSDGTYTIAHIKVFVS